MRLRKKLRVDEFQEFGFSITSQPADKLTEEQVDKFIDDFIDAIEARNLAFGGWIEGGFVCKGSRGSATEEDRTAIEAWLKSRPEIVSVEISPLMDAWHDPSYK